MDDAVSLDDAKQYFEESLPYVVKAFNVDIEEAVDQLPRFTTAATVAQFGAKPPERTPVSYLADVNAIVLNETVVNEHEYFTLKHSTLGEETAHWLRETFGPAGYDSRAGFFTYLSVHEFYGRLGERVAAEEFDEELSDTGTWIPVVWPGREKWTAHEIRERMLESPSELYDRYIQEAYDGYIKEAWNTVAHYAGYKAADEYYREALEDDELLYRDMDETWEKYSIDERELEAIDTLFENP